MYVMIGTWIESELAWTDDANHHRQYLNNTTEIETAVAMANQAIPDIVGNAGNEAMVQWAVKYLFIRILFSSGSTICRG